MARYDDVVRLLAARPERWLVTGVAGFIGSHLLEALLRLDQIVVGVDNFATGSRDNLADVMMRVGAQRAARFQFFEGDICDPFVCRWAMEGVDRVLHEAALGSVPRSMDDPLATHTANVDGFVQVLLAARAAGVRRVVYASSSSVYGDDTNDPKVEDSIGETLSPYAASKRIDEIYASTFARTHGIDSVGIRYFNVFGPRQDPEGAYAAVIPKWVAAMIRGERIVVHGTGETSRDFCHVANVVQANLLAATVTADDALNQAYNVAAGQRTSLSELFVLLRDRLVQRHPRLAGLVPDHGPFRAGDVLHSLADIDKARSLLGYEPTHSVERGLDESIEWYTRSL
jgi:UDP-N-acetylglucosamine 4-epimerase